MPIQPLGPGAFPVLSFQQANPLLTGMNAGQQMMQSSLQFPQELQAKILANKIAAVQAQYAQPMAQQDLTKAKLYNQYYGPLQQALMNLQGSQASQASSEAAKNQYYVNNPSLLAGGNVAQLAYLNGQLQGGGSTGVPQNTFSGGSSLQAGGGSPGNAVAPGVPNVAIPQGMRNARTAGPPYESSLQGMQAPGAGQQSNNPMAQAVMNRIQYGNALTPQQQQNLAVQQNQRLTDVGLYNNDMVQANKESESAAATKNNVSRFLANYDQAHFKGPAIIGGGLAPTSGVTAGFRKNVEGYDLTPEQNADNAAKDLQASMIPLLHTARLTDGELNFLSGMALNRPMTDQAAHTIGPYISAAASRVQEYQQFLNAARQQQIDDPTANALWQLRMQQHPILNVDNQSINNDYAGQKDWGQYLSPAAVNAVRAGQPWEPAITDQDIGHTAQKYKMTIPQVKAKLKAQGRM